MAGNEQRHYDVGMKRRGGKIVTVGCGLAALVVALLLGWYWQEIAAWCRFIVLFEITGPNVSLIFPAKIIADIMLSVDCQYTFSQSI